MKHSKLNIIYFLSIFFAFSVVSYELIFMKKYINNISNSNAVFQESKLLTELYQSNMEEFKTEQIKSSEKKLFILWIQIFEIFSCFLISLIFISKKIRKNIFERLNNYNEAEISYLTLKDSEISYFCLIVFFIFISKTIKCLLYYKKIGFEGAGLGSQIIQLLHVILLLPITVLEVVSFFLKYCKRKYIYLLIIAIIICFYISKSFMQIGVPPLAGYTKLPITDLDNDIQEVITKLNLENNIFVKKNDKFFIDAFFAINFVTKLIILDGGIFKEKYFTQGVLSHELGHATDGRGLLITDLIAEILICIFILFFIDCFISKYYIDENVSRDCSSGIIFLLYFFYFSVCLKPIGNIYSQIFEFRADSFAKSLSQHIPLIESLFAISLNRNPLVSSKLYNILSSTHPSIYERIKNMDKH